MVHGRYRAGLTSEDSLHGVVDLIRSLDGAADRLDTVAPDLVRNHRNEALALRKR